MKYKVRQRQLHLQQCSKRVNNYNIPTQPKRQDNTSDEIIAWREKLKNAMAYFKELHPTWPDEKCKIFAKQTIPKFPTDPSKPRW